MLVESAWGMAFGGEAISQGILGQSSKFIANAHEIFLLTLNVEYRVSHHCPSTRDYPIFMIITIQTVVLA